MGSRSRRPTLTVYEIRQGISQLISEILEELVPINSNLEFTLKLAQRTQLRVDILIFPS
jgi:hypothetical protein